MIQRIQKETVFISNQTGWVRVYLNPDENYSTLVYVTDVTTVQDIVNESKFSENSTIWVQVFKFFYFEIYEIIYRYVRSRFFF